MEDTFVNFLALLKENELYNTHSRIVKDLEDIRCAASTVNNEISEKITELAKAGRYAEIKNLSDRALISIPALSEKLSIDVQNILKKRAVKVKRYDKAGNREDRKTEVVKETENVEELRKAGINSGEFNISLFKELAEAHGLEIKEPIGVIPGCYFVKFWNSYINNIRIPIKIYEVDRRQKINVCCISKYDRNTKVDKEYIWDYALDYSHFIDFLADIDRKNKDKAILESHFGSFSMSKFKNACERLGLKTSTDITGSFCVFKFNRDRLVKKVETREHYHKEDQNTLLISLRDDLRYFNVYWNGKPNYIELAKKILEVEQELKSNTNIPNEDKDETSQEIEQEVLKVEKNEIQESDKRDVQNEDKIEKPEKVKRKKKYTYYNYEYPNDNRLKGYLRVVEDMISSVNPEIKKSTTKEYYKYTLNDKILLTIVCKPTKIKIYYNIPHGWMKDGHNLLEMVNSNHRHYIGAFRYTIEREKGMSDWTLEWLKDFLVQTITYYERKATNK